MAHYDLKTEQLKEMAPKLRAGDTVTLTGTVYTARDAAQRRSLLRWTQATSCRSTSTARRSTTPDRPPQKAGSGHRLGRPDHLRPADPFAPRLLDAGLCLHDRQGRAKSGCAGRNGAQRRGLYGVAIGGAGAAKAASIKNVEVIAYDELGCESVSCLTVENFSAIVSQDSVGGNLYTEGVARYKKRLSQKAGLSAFFFACARQKLGGRR